MALRERSLNEFELNLYQPYFDQRTLNLARIIEGNIPFWLSKRMCAIVIGSRVYLRAELDRPRAYQMGTSVGVELLAHELTHVEQYLSGMTIWKYIWASRNGYRKNPYEIEAYQKGAIVKSRIFLR